MQNLWKKRKILKKSERSKARSDFGDSWGIRTPDAAVRGQSLNRLTKEPHNF